MVVSGRQLRFSDSLDGASILSLVAGTYQLTVDGALGAYAFRLVDLATATPIVPGIPVEGQLNPGNETDIYRFDVTAGQRFFLDAQQITNNDATWRLLTPYGDQVFPTTSAGVDVDVLTLSLTGAYRLLIEGRRSNTAPNNYRFNVQPVIDDVTPISVGTSSDPRWTPGQIGGGLAQEGLQYVQIPNGEAVNQRNELTIELWFKVDRFANAWTNLLFKGEEEGAVTYSLSLNSSGYLWFSTRRGQLTSPVCSVEPGRWYHAAGVADRAPAQLRMYLDGAEVAAALLSSGSFAASAGPLLLGSAVPEEGRVAFEGTLDEVRIWSIPRTAAQIAAAQDAPLTGTEAGLALELRLDETSGHTAFDNGPLAAHGTVVSPVDGAAGAVLGRIPYPGQVDPYTFTLAQRTRLYFDALTDSPVSWTLTGPTGTVAADRDFQSSDATDVVPLLDLVAGAYTFTFDAAGDNVVPYAFRLIDAASAVSITPGTVVSGELAPGSETNLYRFDVSAGERFYFDSHFGGGYWRLLTPYGDQVFFNPASADVPATTPLSVPGTYWLSIEGPRYAASSRISYEFNVQPVVDDVRPLVIGASAVVGQIASPGETDRYTFTLAQRTRLYFDALTDSLVTWTP